MSRLQAAMGSKAESNSSHAIAGAVSGFITRFICQPLDVIKIRFQVSVYSLIKHSKVCRSFPQLTILLLLQLQVEPISRYHVSKYGSVSQAFLLILKEEGIFALWKGHVPAQLLSIVYGMSQVQNNLSGISHDIISIPFSSIVAYI